MKGRPYQQLQLFGCTHPGPFRRHPGTPGHDQRDELGHRSVAVRGEAVQPQARRLDSFPALGTCRKGRGRAFCRVVWCFVALCLVFLAGGGGA